MILIKNTEFSNKMRKQSFPRSIRYLLLTPFFLLLLFFGVRSNLHAADLEITCSQPENNCLKSNEAPLFGDESELWFPGKSVSKVVSLVNESDFVQEITFEGTQKSKLKNGFDAVLQVRLTDNSTQRLIWKGSLSDFHRKEKISLGALNPKAKFDFTFMITMDSSAEPQYQNQKLVFDFSLRFSAGKVMGDSASQSSNGNEEVSPKTKSPKEGWWQQILSSISRFFQTLIDFVQHSIQNILAVIFRPFNNSFVL